MLFHISVPFSLQSDDTWPPYKKQNEIEVWSLFLIKWDLFGKTSTCCFLCGVSYLWDVTVSLKKFQKPLFFNQSSKSNLMFAEFQWIRMSTCWVIVNLIAHRSTCMPYDVTILIVVVVCSESIVSVVFWFFKRWYLWNQIRYQENAHGVHSCFSCTFIRETINFHFISTLISLVKRWAI